MNNASKFEKEKLKLIQEKCQTMLNNFLRDDDNKYCVDCDAKGPRWASWNLGVFVCIRCAGIHRKLGVHISRIKSVNLDTWTPEQVMTMERMGNSKGRAVYEGNLPENFRRPQTDLALETFIQDKYEKKKYIAHEWKGLEPIGKVDWDKEIEEELRNAKKNKTAVNANQSKFKITVPTNDANKVNSKIEKPKAKIEDPPKVVAPNATAASPGASTASSNFSNDLLGLDIQSPNTNTSSPSTNTVNPESNSNIDNLSDLSALSDLSQNQNQKLSTANILKLYGNLPPAPTPVMNPGVGPNFQQSVPTAQSTNPFHQLGGLGGNSLVGGVGGGLGGLNLFNNPLPMTAPQQPQQQPQSSFLNAPQQSLITSGLAGLQLGPSSHQQNNFFQ